MSMTWLLAAIAALLSAGLYLSITLGSLGMLMLTYLAPFPLFMVGLSMGSQRAGIAGAVGALMIWAINGSPAAILFFLTCVLPVSLLCDRATRPHIDPHGGPIEWYPAGRLCTFLPLIPALGFLSCAVYFQIFADGLEAVVARHVEEWMQVYRSAMGQTGAAVANIDTDRLSLVEIVLSRIAPALVAVIWMLVMVLNGTVAQMALTRMNFHLRMRAEFTNIALPGWLIGTVCLTLLAGITLGSPFGFLGANLAAIFAFPVFLSGLALAHLAAARTRFRFGILFGLYAIILASGWTSLVLVLLGLIDHFMELKKRVSGSSPRR